MVKMVHLVILQHMIKSTIGVTLQRIAIWINLVKFVFCSKQSFAK